MSTWDPAGGGGEPESNQQPEQQPSQPPNQPPSPPWSVQPDSGRGSGQSGAPPAPQHGPPGPDSWPSPGQTGQSGQYGQQGQWGQPPSQWGQPPSQYGQPQGQYTPAPPPPPAGYGQYGGYGGYQGGGGGGATPFGPPANMGNRLLARIIDAFIIGIPSAILVGILGAVAFSGTHCDTDSAGVTSCHTNGGGVGLFLLGYLIVLLAALFYELYFIGAKGATIGKKAMHVKVVDAQTGGPIGMGRAFVRYLVLAVTGSICTLGYWSPFFDSSKRLQGWHDKASNDFVVGDT